MLTVDADHSIVVTTARESSTTLVSCSVFGSTLLVRDEERFGCWQGKREYFRAMKCQCLLRVGDEGHDSASFDLMPAIQRASRSSFPPGLAGADLEWAKTTSVPLDDACTQRIKWQSGEARDLAPGLQGLVNLPLSAHAWWKKCRCHMTGTSDGAAGSPV